MKILLLMVTSFFFIMVPVAAEYGSIEITTDIPKVPVYIDDVYTGLSPVHVDSVQEGYHLVQASPEGFFSQTENISVKAGELTSISFSFLNSEEKQIPAMVRIGECVGTPEPSDLDGTAFDLLRMPDGTLMAYYSGWEEGIMCMHSSDGISWEQMNEPCLGVPSKGTVFRTEPWVYALPDGSYRMVFRQTAGSRHALYSVPSQDGRTFSGEEEIFIDGEMSEGTSGSPSVPTGIIYDNGTIRMYYSIPGEGIKSAISDDMGLSWKKEDGVRIRYGTDPTMILLPDKRTGIFYVDTTPKSKGQRIFFSLSDDGLDFSRVPPIQILETMEPGVWLMDPEIITDDDVVYLYFSVMGMEGMQHHLLPGTLRSIINLPCLVRQVSEKKSGPGGI
ncbi:MAG TPA: PEGA domain-containing protein [Methanospirillum sp.]|uniref:PEGA domain-containing protein n=1 Tax=Methanospirillum sp. TaxID=45200 RepID=UPI002C59ECA4|nr:PEGA domain-containing protein [Methanospirillum sp.]HOJ96197.1 PEGA domain-containing protein [Methanospirillum sp.]